MEVIADCKFSTLIQVPPWAPAMVVICSSMRVPPMSLQPQFRASTAPDKLSFTQLG